MNLLHLSKIAIKAALAAGDVIQKHMHNTVPVDIKEAGTSYASQVVTIVDKEAESAILAHIIPSCEENHFALLSEETEDDKSRFEKEMFWCIDPMDGTLAFIKKRSGFSVSIALVAKDGTPHIGVVYDPSSGNLYHAIKGHGAYKNNIPWVIQNTNQHLTYITDRKLEDTPHVEKIKKLLIERKHQLNLTNIVEIHGAGAVLNAILVLENGPACMLKLPKENPGGGSIWDFAATSCIYQELGLPATNFNKGSLDLNRTKSTFMNHEGVYFENFAIDS